MRWFRRLFNSPLREAAERMRWVVVDCESSGLDPSADRLLSIGAIAVVERKIKIAAGFSVVLRQQEVSDASNIVIHRISGSEQLAGIEGEDALRLFAQFAGTNPLVAFHAPFDRTLLTRAARAVGVRLRNPWLDLAQLAPVLYPEQAVRCRALDDWLACFGIQNLARHTALGDAYATAQLFQVLLERAREQGLNSAKEILKAPAARRWLPV